MSRKRGYSTQPLFQSEILFFEFLSMLPYQSRKDFFAFHYAHWQHHFKSHAMNPFSKKFLKRANDGLVKIPLDRVTAALKTPSNVLIERMKDFSCSPVARQKRRRNTKNTLKTSLMNELNPHTIY
ncbi:hypothetical protein [Bacillus vallismortis]|uniref:hypothetical protein n=1 Tax=Bacillus vallismortis TaxID=72361 RepID=UPI00227ED06E|nr:hypothetical protein [Bacillus vallismortis]MCY7917640.1 hypothetical protein [Bacillus vallismortis]